SDATTAGFKLRNTKATVYQMETGFRTIAYNNYINHNNGEFISNIDKGVEFSEGDKVFIDNGCGLPMMSDYNKYSITFKAQQTTTSIGDEYFRLLIGTNKPTFDKTISDQNKGIYLAYRKETADINSLYFGFYKQVYEFRAQMLYADDEYQNYDTGPDLLDGQEHTINVLISREAISYYDPNYVVQSSMVYTAEIYVDGSLIDMAYIPVSNDLSNWTLKGSGGSGLGDDITYDHNFLNSNLYPGFEVMTSEFEVLDFLVY
ncbi:MAG: hypothetical protein ACOCWI_03770, partial [Bacillota bacterium]